jgi:ribosomal protein S17E
MKTLTRKMMARFERWPKPGEAPARRWRIVRTTWAVAAVAAACVTFWQAHRAPAQSLAPDPELDAAMADTLLKVLERPDCPQDPETLQTAVEEYFRVLYPDLWAREFENNPGAVEQAAASQTLLPNPAVIRAELMKDPGFAAREAQLQAEVAGWLTDAVRRRQQAALEQTVAEWKAAHPEP